MSRFNKSLMSLLHQQGFKRYYISHDCTSYTKTVGSRWLLITLWANGNNHATHYLNGRMSTHATKFSGTDELLTAIAKELTRTDHLT